MKQGDKIDENQPAIVGQEISQEETGAVIDLGSVETIVSMELKKFDTNKDKIAELKTQFSGLTINGVDDKEGYKKVVAALAVVRPIRTGVEKTRKSAKEKYLKTGSGIDAYAKELTALLSDVEDPLQKMKDDIDNAVENARIEEENRKTETLKLRIQELIDNGMAFTGTQYSIGNEQSQIVVDEISLKMLDDAGYADLLEGVKKLNAVLIEEKKIADDLAEKNRLKVKAQEDELKQMKEERGKLRIEKLVALGFKLIPSQDKWVASNRASTMELHEAGGLAEMDSASWQSLSIEAETKAEAMKTALSDLETKEEADRIEQQTFEHRVSVLTTEAAQRGVTVLQSDFAASEIRTLEETAFESKMKEVLDGLVSKKEEKERVENERAAKAKKTFERTLELEKIGFSLGSDGGFVLLTAYNTAEPYRLAKDHVENATDEEFELYLNDARVTKKTFDGLDEKFILDEKARMEEERQKDLTDIEKIEEWLAELKKVPVPEIGNPHMKEGVQILTDGFIGIEQMLSHFKNI